MLKLILPLVALLAVGGSAAGAAVYLVKSGETAGDALPPAVVQTSPEPSPAVTTAEEPAPATSATKGGQAPDACLTGESAYVDPDGRFAFCYPAEMELVTVDTPQGLAATVQFPPVDDPRMVTVTATYGLVEDPFQLCNDSPFVIGNERIEDLMVAGVTVQACFQEHFDRSQPPVLLFTTVEFIVPTKSGTPVQVLIGYGPPDRVRDGVSVRDIAFRTLQSAVVD